MVGLMYEKIIKIMMTITCAACFLATVTMFIDFLSDFETMKMFTSVVCLAAGFYMLEFLRGVK